MSTHSEIDETLSVLGSAEPPSGLESRVKMRLQAPRRSFFPTDFDVPNCSRGSIGGERRLVRRGIESWPAQHGVSPCRWSEFPAGP